MMMKSVVIASLVLSTSLAVGNALGSNLDALDCLENTRCALSNNNLLAYDSGQQASYSQGPYYTSYAANARSRQAYASTHRSYSTYRSMSFPKKIKSPGEKLFVFSPRHKVWAAYSASGERLSTGIANGGAEWCSDLGRPCRTPAGSYRVHSKGSYDCKSSRFPLPNGGAPMPYCMHFGGGGYAIHGSPYISNVNGSHGCIRVTTGDAQWLSSAFISHGTKVMVMSY